MMKENCEKTRTPADTLIVSARVESFRDVFLGERAWYPIRINDRRKNELKWICIYQNSPIRAITHYARIVSILNHAETGRYKISVDTIVELKEPITIGLENGLSMQGQKYTSFDRLMQAKTIADLKPWNLDAQR